MPYWGSLCSLNFVLCFKLGSFAQTKVILCFSEADLLPRGTTFLLLTMRAGLERRHEEFGCRSEMDWELQPKDARTSNETASTAALLLAKCVGLERRGDAFAPELPD